MVQSTRPWPNPSNDTQIFPIMVTEWKKVFAWRPVELVSGRRVWFKFVYKRKFYTLFGLQQIQYGDILDVLKEGND